MYFQRGERVGGGEKVTPNDQPEWETYSGLRTLLTIRVVGFGCNKVLTALASLSLHSVFNSDREVLESSYAGQNVEYWLHVQYCLVDCKHTDFCVGTSCKVNRQDITWSQCCNTNATQHFMFCLKTFAFP